MTNPPPNDLNANLPEDEPVQSEHASIMLGFAPAMLNIPNNNNGWIEEDYEEEMEAEEDVEEEIGVEVMMMKMMLRSFTPMRRLIPSIGHHLAPRQRSKGEGSSATVFNPALCGVYPPGPMVNDPNTLYSRVKTLTKQMWDRYRVESSSFKRLKKNDMRMDNFDDDLTALDSTLREQIQEIMKKLMAELNEQFQQIQERNLRAENEMVRIRLRVAEEKAKDKHMDAEYYKYHLAHVSWLYDDLSRWESKIREQNMPSRKMTQAAIEKLIADAITRDRATRGNLSGADRSRGNNKDQGGSPLARECTYAGFMKCNPITFRGVEGAVGLCHWFEKIESVFSISECAERNKVKFVAATL
nr:reverse transcriptase domain-containing protein [Tanacetum cinerariifolium]